MRPDYDITATDLRADLLVGEDDPDDRFLIVHALKRIRPQLSVVTVCDGIQLIEYIQQRRSGTLPRLVLLDLNMPRMDGREVLIRLHADPALCNIPVVVMTTSVEPEDRSRAQALNATGFISKPDEFARMVEVLRVLLDEQLGPVPKGEI